MTAQSDSSASKANGQEAFTQTEEVILRRRSVRNYKKGQVPEWMIRRILEAGRFAPSAGNCQPWKFVVVRDPDMIQELTNDVVKLSAMSAKLIDYRDNGSWWKKIMAKLLIKLKPSMLHPTPFGAVRFIADGKLGLYHGAPTIIIIFKDTRGISSPELDCGIAGQNMVLAAHSLGLGTCWVGFSKLAFDYMGKWKKKFGIDYPYKFANSIGIGFPLGDADGEVPRPLHPVEWFEDGEHKTIDDTGPNRTVPKSERKRIPDYSDKTQIVPGVVKVDEEKCTGCTLCLKACPANAMEMVEKKANMRPIAEHECVMCGACIAICPADAITEVEQAHFSGRFTEVDRGDLVPPRIFPEKG